MKTLWEQSSFQSSRAAGREPQEWYIRMASLLSMSYLELNIFHGASASASPLPMNIQGWFPLELAGLKLQWFGHLMQRADSLEKTLLLGKTEGRRRRRRQRMRRLDGISDSMEEKWRTGKCGMLQSTGLQRVRHKSKRLDHFSYPKGHSLKQIWNQNNKVGLEVGLRWPTSKPCLFR